MENITITKNQLFKVIKMNEQSEEKPKEGKNETSSFVITSYSIHYTKLYDLIKSFLPW